MAEMTAKEYLEAKKRMTQNCDLPDCEMCPLSGYNNGLDIGCEELEVNYPDKAIEIVQKWADEHPKKTRLTEFKRLFPNAKMTNGFPIDCIRAYDCTEECSYFSTYCNKCQAKFWDEEI